MLKMQFIYIIYTYCINPIKKKLKKKSIEEIKKKIDIQTTELRNLNQDIKRDILEIVKLNYKYEDLDLNFEYLKNLLNEEKEELKKLDIEKNDIDYMSSYQNFFAMNKEKSKSRIQVQPDFIEVQARNKEIQKKKEKRENLMLELQMLIKNLVNLIAL